MGKLAHLQAMCLLGQCLRALKFLDRQMLCAVPEANRRWCNGTRGRRLQLKRDLLRLGPGHSMQSPVITGPTTRSAG
ncbi:hypothetical protein K449DRAFT_211337 [Hypoxylon sp. EC38]|nr:hypothetical protein K449DRAFT_211337 [Hypoxylon sp. EC38]